MSKGLFLGLNFQRNILKKHHTFIVKKHFNHLFTDEDSVFDLHQYPVTITILEGYKVMHPPIPSPIKNSHPQLNTDVQYRCYLIHVTV